ncbi:hypothetical protein EIP86_004842 [Pleurotus ostreatoroseus]|nr:hypothetical protein EIP86_004842 [Pleurotus ostreatoroseus]
MSDGSEKPVFKIGLWDYVNEVAPPFGHAMHEFFEFDPGYINLNHGSFGSLPTPVHRACTVLSDKIEANPDKFIRLEYYPLLLSVRERLAKFLGAKTEECVLVPNASAAGSIILRGVQWKSGDVMITMTTTYGNIAKTVQFVHDLHPEVALSVFNLSFPMTHADIIKTFKDHLKTVSRPVPTNDNPKPKIFCVIDTIISNPGILLPWQEMVKICTEEGIFSIIDAAHSVGQEVNISLSEAQPDFWFSNCHKWLYAKRPCAVLNQHMLRSSFPTSHLYYSPGQSASGDWMNSGDSKESWARQFHWTGTLDQVPFLSINSDFRQWLGGEEKINAYCRDLAIRGGKRLAEVLNTSVMDRSDNHEETLNMVNAILLQWSTSNSR